MAEAPPAVETDPDFEPLPRPRSCTWPLPRPEFGQCNSATSSPAPTGAVLNPDASAGLPGAAAGADFMRGLSLLEERGDFPRAPGSAAAPGGLCGDFQGPEASCLRPAPPPPPGPLPPPPGPPSGPGPLAGQPRKSSSSRRNAWGNLSYADLITKAIESSAEKRLTLSQIYEWMVKSVPYFKDKGDSNSSAGWKFPVWISQPLCSSRFCSGLPGEEAQVASKLIADVIENSQIIQKEDLRITQGKLAWVLYCDLICLDYDGNILDACTFALLAALKDGGSGLTGAKLQDCMSRAVTRHREVKKLMDEVIQSMKPK